MRYMEGYTHMISPCVIAVMHFVHAAHEKNAWKSVLVSDCSSELFIEFFFWSLCVYLMLESDYRALVLCG
jgi:hypothetical protein